MSEIDGKGRSLDQDIKSFLGYNNIEAVPGLVIRTFFEIIANLGMNTLDFAIFLSEKMPFLGSFIDIKARFDAYAEFWGIARRRPKLREILEPSLITIEENREAANTVDHEPTNDQVS